MVLGLIQKKASTVKPKNRFLFTIILFSILNAIYGIVMVSWFAYTIHTLKQPDRASDYNFTFCAVYLFLNSIAHFTFEEWVLSEGCYTMKYCETPSERTRTVMWLTRFVTGWGWIINTTYLCALVLRADSYADAQSLRGPFLTGVLIGMVDLCSELRSGSWPFFAHHIFSMVLMLLSAEFGYFEIGCILYTPQQAYDKLVWPIFFFSRLRILRDRNDQLYLKAKEEEEQAQAELFADLERKRFEQVPISRQISSRDLDSPKHQINEPFYVDETGVFNPVELTEAENDQVVVKQIEGQNDTTESDIPSVFIASRNADSDEEENRQKSSGLVSPLFVLPVPPEAASNEEQEDAASGSSIIRTPTTAAECGTTTTAILYPTSTTATMTTSSVRIPEILIPGGYTPSVSSLTPLNSKSHQGKKQKNMFNDEKRRRNSTATDVSCSSAISAEDAKPWTRLPWGPMSPYGKLATDQSFKRASAYHAHRHAIAIGEDHFVDDLIPSYTTLSYWYCAMFLYYAILIRSAITILIAAYLGLFWDEIPTYWKVIHPLSTFLFIASDWDVYPLIFRRSYWSNGGKASSVSSSSPSAVPEEPS